MHPILFKIGSFTIYTYGVFVFLGVLAGYFVCSRYAKKLGVEDKVFSNIFFWTIVSSFLGAKVLYLLLDIRYFIKDPLSFLRSGFVFYGGIIGGALALFLLARKYNIRLAKLGDIFCLGIPLGHAFGRIGCFFYGCCYGKPSDCAFCVLFPPDSPAGMLGVKLIPTQLISAFFLVVIFLVLRLISKRKKFEGQIFTSYFVIYGIFRFIIEFFRGDPRGMFFSLSTSQIISIFLVAAGIIFFWRLKKLKV